MRFGPLFVLEPRSHGGSTPAAFPLLGLANVALAQGRIEAFVGARLAVGLAARLEDGMKNIGLVHAAGDDWMRTVLWSADTP